jgi:uncharacterized protein YndB with AHSA1/START domain
MRRRMFVAGFTGAFAGAHDGMRQGWTGTLDQLAEYLTKA